MAQRNASTPCSGHTVLADDHGCLVTQSCAGSILLRVGFVTLQLPPHALEQLGVTLVRASMKLHREQTAGDTTDQTVDSHEQIVH